MNLEITDEEFKRILRKKAEAGDPIFQTQVGLCYYRGHGIDENKVEAVKWYKLAAEQGYASAQCEYGNTFFAGAGVKLNYEEAVKWYKLAAEQGYARAQNNLAARYHDGTGVTQNLNEAIRLYTLSSEQGYWCASAALGYLYFDEEDVEQDLKKAKHYFEKALADTDFWESPASDNEKKEIQDRINEVNKLLKVAEEARKSQRTDVFISYAHADMAYKDDLTIHLKALNKAVGTINYWDDSQIKSGDEWKEKINAALSKARVAILLISANFFASEFVARDELPHILEAADSGGTTILWLLVSHCDYEDRGIDKYQSLTKPKKPIKALSSAGRDEVYTKLVKRIKEIYNT